MMPRYRVSLLVALTLVFAGTVSAQVLKREPPMGAMKEGEIVLVDDGICPKGQIKRVVGGDHTKVGGTKQMIRTHSCVAK